MGTARWKGRWMFRKADTACTGAECCAWSRKYRWQDWYLGYHSKMSNCGSSARCGGGGTGGWEAKVVAEWGKGGELELG